MVKNLVIPDGLKNCYCIIKYGPWTYGSYVFLPQFDGLTVVSIHYRLNHNIQLLKFIFLGPSGISSK
jgi:hypothetical protein